MSAESEIASHIQEIADAVKGTIGTPDLSSSGKLQPAKWAKPKRKKSGVEATLETEEGEEGKTSAVKEAGPGSSKPALFAEIIKAEKRIVTGLVLQPEVVDGQGDIMSAEIIAKAAHDWLSKIHKQTKLGLQHSSFKKNEDRFVVVESYLAPIEFVMETKAVKKGTWVLSVKVLDDEIWEAVKDGEITGFSIGGKATAEDLEEES